MTVSIIIAVKTWQKNLEDCVNKCLELDYPDFEILILPDEPIEQQGVRASFEKTCLSHGGVSPITVIPTGCLNPGQKRDIALKYAKGEILAFIDDDAYPKKDWLKNAILNFQDPEIAAVGGPALTPKEDSLRQKASGLTFASVLVSGQYIYRYLSKNKLEVDDYPSCNLLVRKAIMLELGGFKTRFWPGEDTVLCRAITKKLGKKIIYDPKVEVFHHRRPLFIAHLGQIANYALHRGYFAKLYPETSLRVSYFIPTFFLFSLIFWGVLSLFSLPIRILYLAGLSLYIFLVFIFSISKQLYLTPYVILGTILTHISYGIYFLKGLLAKKLPEEK